MEKFLALSQEKAGIQSAMRRLPVSQDMDMKKRQSMILR